MINLDMIAWDGDDDGQFDIHTGKMEGSITLGQIIASNASEWETNLVPELKILNATRASDHRNFWDADIPAMLIIENFLQDFNPFYHTTGDEMDLFNVDYFLKLSRLVIGTLAELSGQITRVAEITPPVSFDMVDPYPNPFNASVNLEFDLNRGASVILTVYDARGRIVRTLIDRLLPAGRHHIIWDGSDTAGLNVATGVYFVRLSARDHMLTRKILLLR
jgi:hypothetical protein